MWGVGYGVPRREFLQSVDGPDSMTETAEPDLRFGDALRLLPSNHDRKPPNGRAWQPHGRFMTLPMFPERSLTSSKRHSVGRQWVTAQARRLTASCG